MLASSVHDCGHQDWMVLLHGLGGTAGMWKHQLNVLLRRYNVLLVDLHGHGESRECSLLPLGEPKLEGVARAVFDVMDARGIESAVVMGASLGTMVIRAMLEADPKRVRAAVLCGTVMEYHLLLRQFLSVGYYLQGVLPKGFVYGLSAWATMPRFRQQKARQFYTREVGKLPKAEFYAWLKVLTRHAKTYPPEGWRQFDVPRLFVYGSFDHFFLKGALPHIKADPWATLYVVEHTGHLVNIEAPMVFNQRVLAFLNACEHMQ